MSRLIDADVLLEHIKKLECHAENKKYEQGLNDFLQCYFPQIIDNQPTAFDTEKVVEEVKKLDLDGVSMVEDGKYTLVRRNEVISLIQTNGVCNGRQKSCKYCYKKDCPLSTEKTLSDKWSDIVKKGGVE